MGGLTKIYFNHIPKTGGMDLSLAILKSIKDSKINFIPYTIGDRGNANKDQIIKSDFISGHLGIEPNSYIDNLKTFTIVRNPIDRIISNYLMIYEQQNLVNLDHFNNWIFNDDIGYLTKNNLQSRFLTTTRRDDVEKDFFSDLPKNNNTKIMERHYLIQENGFGIKKENVDYNLAKNYLDKCSIVFTTENLYKDIYKVFDLISKEWNIKIKTPNDYNKIQKSLEFKKLLNNKQTNKIISLNEIDMEIWEYAKTMS